MSSYCYKIKALIIIGSNVQVKEDEEIKKNTTGNIFSNEIRDSKAK